MLKKLLFFSLGGILAVYASFKVVQHTGPDLPEYTTEIVDSVLDNPLPNLYRGRMDTVNVNGVNIWYESIGDTNQPTILMIMGMGGSAMEWPEFLIDSLLQAGYHLIRYDHRDVGASDKMLAWDADRPYTLSDLSKDALGIIDKLGIDQLHVIGYSMGGMIAQQLAIDHPERILALTLISTSGYTRDPELSVLSNYMKYHLLRMVLVHASDPTEYERIGQELESQTILRRGRTLTPEEVREISTRTLFDWRNKRKEHPEVGKHHVAAILESGSRLTSLASFIIPTLILHGTRDPFVTPAHAEKLHQTIPDSKLTWIEGMAHAITAQEQDQLLPPLFMHLRSNTYAAGTSPDLTSSELQKP